jgi:hypothetical protein
VVANNTSVHVVVVNNVRNIPAICDAIFVGMSSVEQRKDRLIHRSSQKQDSESQD